MADVDCLLYASSNTYLRRKRGARGRLPAIKDHASSYSKYEKRNSRVGLHGNSCAMVSVNPGGITVKGSFEQFSEKYGGSLLPVANQRAGFTITSQKWTNQRSMCH